MGIRVEYQEVPQGDLRKAMVSDFHLFERWHQAWSNDSHEETDYEIMECFSKVENPKSLFDQIPKDSIDAFTGMYLEYLDICGKSNRVSGSCCLYISHYYDVDPLIERKCNPETSQLWKLLINGRSLLKSKPFSKFDPVFRYCVLSESECQQLRTDLSNQFNVSNPEKFNALPAIGATIDAIDKKEGQGMLVTVA